MPHRVSYSDEYDRVREQITPGENWLIAEAEDQIAANPSPKLRGRFEDAGYIYDTSAEDFMIEYHLLENGWISFDRLIDLRKPDL